MSPFEYCIEHMRSALLLAERAYSQGEVPVGAVVVLNGEVIGQGWNQPISACDPTAHAEVLALRDAAAKMGNYRLPGAELYVTIEPCTMCAGALMHARIARLIYGASEPKAGVVNSQGNVLSQPHWNHRLEWQGGVLAEEAAQLMQRFFQQRRVRKLNAT